MCLSSDSRRPNVGGLIKALRTSVTRLCQSTAADSEDELYLIAKIVRDLERQIRSRFPLLRDDRKAAWLRHLEDIEALARMVDPRRVCDFS